MYRVSSAPIDVGSVAASVRADTCGAVVTFAGVVRELSDDERTVTGLSYEAHGAMAEAEFERIAAEARERFGPCRVAVVHRTGDLKVGEVSVAVAVSAPHRGAAFDACEYVIDELKHRAPIWKKEHYSAGGSEWRASR